MEEQRIPSVKRKPRRQGPSSSKRSHQPQKQKISHPARSPPSFWDNLSKVHLTKNALRELDRRNRDSARSARNFSRKQPYRRVTRRFAVDLGTLVRQGGPDLSDLRGVSQPQEGGAASTSEPTSTRTSGAGQYDRCFLQHLIDSKISRSEFERANGRTPPGLENIDEIGRVLKRRRLSLSSSCFTREDFAKFKLADAQATNERGVTEWAVPILEGRIGDYGCVAAGVPFTNLDHLTDGSLMAANPSRYYGARPGRLNR